MAAHGNTLDHGSSRDCVKFATSFIRKPAQNFFSFFFDFFGLHKLVRACTSKKVVCRFPDVIAVPRHVSCFLP
jgi:hypothetical protein